MEIKIGDKERFDAYCEENKIKPCVLIRNIIYKEFNIKEVEGINEN